MCHLSKLIGFFLGLTVSASATLGPGDDSIVFGALAYTMTQLDDARAVILLEQNVDSLAEQDHAIAIVRFLRSVNQTVREDAGRIANRENVCRNGATDEEVRQALKEFDRKTEEVWARLHEGSSQTLGDDMSGILVEAVSSFRQSVSYTKTAERPDLNKLMRSICTKQR